MTATLSELKLGSLILNPAFDDGVTTYTAETANATTRLTVVPTEAGAAVTVLLDGAAVEAGQDGKFSLAWAAGENVVTIKVDGSDQSKTYTITVTKS